MMASRRRLLGWFWDRSTTTIFIRAMTAKGTRFPHGSASLVSDAALSADLNWSLHSTRKPWGNRARRITCSMLENLSLRSISELPSNFVRGYGDRDWEET